MIRILSLSVIVFALLSAAVSTPAQARNVDKPIPGPETKYSADLKTALSSIPAGDKITVIVTLQAQSAAQLISPSTANRAERVQHVVNTLQANSHTSQKNIRALLSQEQKNGAVDQVVPFWIFNGLSVTATPAVIQELASRPDVLSISRDLVITAPKVRAVPAPGPAQTGLIPVTGSESSLQAQPNLTTIHAPDLWSKGYLGQGIVVANVDTGVDGSHPDLASQYRGGSNSWFDPYQQHATPTDLDGHGTWTMGVMVGKSASGSAVGVAPGAKWIAARIFDDNDSATFTAIHQAYQWLLDPDGNPATADAPDVVNSSWGFQIPGCDLSFEADIQALRAAGILPIFSAGNSGPSADSSTSPANNPGVFSVGATDSNDSIYFQSSRGSTTCGQPEAVFPTVTAPGVSIYSTGLSGSYTYSTGTSLAAPHVAGILALLLSAKPGLSVSEQERLLSGGVVDLGAPGPDNDFGDGRVDGMDAFMRMQQGNTSGIPRIFLPYVVQ